MQQPGFYADLRPFAAPTVSRALSSLSNLIFIVLSNEGEKAPQNKSTAAKLQQLTWITIYSVNIIDLWDERSVKSYFIIALLKSKDQMCDVLRIAWFLL